jgi:hypothetical protein
LLDLALREKERYNFTPRGLTNAAWATIFQEFEDKGYNYTNKQITNKFDALKRSFVTWKGLQQKTGLGRDPRTGRVVGDEDIEDSTHTPPEGTYTEGTGDSTEDQVTFPPF